MTRNPRRVHPGLVAGVVALTAWVGCAIAVEAGPLSSTVSGPVLHSADSLTLPHLQAVPVNGSAPVVVSPTRVTPKPRHRVTKVTRPVTAAPAPIIAAVAPVTPAVRRPVVKHRTSIPSKPQPLQVGVEIPDPTNTLLTVPVSTVVVITPVSTAPTDGSTPAIPVATTDPAGPVAAGTDAGSGAESTALPPVESTIPETPIPTPPAPPSSDPAPPAPTTPVVTDDPGTTVPTPPAPSDTATGTPTATPTATPPG